MPPDAPAPFAAASAADSDWRIATERVLADLADRRGGATLGFLYASDHFAHVFGDILGRLRDGTGVVDWLGTVGMGVAATGVEHYDRPALAAMLTDLPADCYRLFEVAAVDPVALAAGIAPAGAAGRAPLAVVHGDPRNGHVLDALPTFAAKTGSYLVGALTASRAGPHPQLAGRLMEGGLSGGLISGRVPVATGVTQGCTPIGPAHEVTAAEGNVLIELDGRPALAVFREEIGDLLARDLRRTVGFIFAALPVGGSDTGDYLVRNVVGANEAEGLLGIGDAVAAGARVMFCRRDNAAAEQDLRRLAGRLAERADGRARGALYHSCLARGPNMFADGGSEADIIAEALPDVPLVGVFGNGEIAGDRLYTMTGVLTLFL